MHDGSTYHVPVLVDESIDGLDIKKNGVYVDGTLGGGGHFRRIIDKLEGTGTAVGIDRDADATELVKSDLPQSGSRVIVEQTNFASLPEVLKKNGIEMVDGILLDLGVSKHQIFDPLRGFTFMKESELDMRMDRRESLDARELIAQSTLDGLTEILQNFGEISNSRRMARAMKDHYKQYGMQTTGDLKRCFEKEYGHQLSIPVLARVYQALRIAVNNELGELKACLELADACLAPDGRIVVISYHSLEDRIVKRFFMESEKSGILMRLTKKTIRPSYTEVSRNRSARSAKLRIAKKISYA